jgi:hypothetical protein
MNSDRTPTYDPADGYIANALKNWVNVQQVPAWSRSQLLASASQPIVKQSSLFVLRMVIKWVLLRGIELISFLVSEDPLVFLPSRDHYYYNPPHFKHCVVHTRVQDMFLLEAGMLGAV